MDRAAVFVDAGYLFAQGSTALVGSKRPRAQLILNAPAAIDQFLALAAEKAPDARLLRVYWYDGAIGGTRPTSDQAVLAHLDNVKLRLGFINSAGQQKGVDSLIVTDLIELARLGSLSDAILLSGDEDVRIGVQIAQNYGVRVHLVGIRPSRGSQAHQLLQEVDTTTEWDAPVVETFLSLRPDEVERSVEPAGAVMPADPSADERRMNSELDDVVADYVAALSKSDVAAIAVYWESERGIPFEHDRILLPRGREKLGRDLDRVEIQSVRSRFRRLVRARLEGQTGSGH